MKLVDTVLENMMISFSGRVNILDSETKQFVGSLTQSEGDYKRVPGKGYREEGFSKPIDAGWPERKVFCRH